MSRTIFVLIGVILLMGMSVLAQGPVINMAITGRQLADVNQANGGRRDLAAANRLAFTDDGLVVSDNSDLNNERVYLVDIDTNPPTFTLLVDETKLKDKVAEFATRPVLLTIRGLRVDSQGNIIIATDGGSGEVAFLFRLNPRAGELALLSGLDGTPSSIEGLTALAVAGTTAYVALERGFGAPSGDSVVAVSTVGPDGGKAAATVLVSEAALMRVVTSGDIAIRDIEGLRGSGSAINQLVAVNSATAGANDDILAIDLSTGAVSVLVAATDIEADLGVTDIGPSAMAIDPNGTIYLINKFGVGTADDGIIAVANPGNGAGTATLLASRQQIISAPTVRDIRGRAITALEFIDGNSMIAPALGEVLFSEGNSDGVIRVRQQ
jgi:hypothetical protein